MDENKYLRLTKARQERTAKVIKDEWEAEQRRRRHEKLQRRLKAASRREKAWGDWLTHDHNCDGYDPV